jgi:methyl-accepting chemotaxis protein
MDGAIQYYMQGRNNLAGSEISDAHLVVQDMNDQLLQLTALFQKRLKEANLNVENALDHTLEASVSVADYSQKASERIKDIEQRTLIILLFSIPLAIFVAVIIILSITRPLKRLEEQLISIESHSDLTRHLSIEGKDEISAMSLAIRNLLAKFCSR